MGKNAKFFASKLPRKTEIDEIVKNKKHGPSPVTYKPREVKSRRSVFSSKLDRSGFIEDARARSKESPPPYKVNFSQVKPRLKGMGFLPGKKTNLDQIKKINKPDMGSYNGDVSYLKTIKRIKVPSMVQNNIPKMQDRIVKQSKGVPGVGHYQWEKSFDNSTRAPLFRKGRY